MITRITRLLLLIQFISGGGIFALLHLYYSLPAGVATVGSLLIVILVRLWITTNNFVIAYLHRSPRPGQYQIGPWQTFKLVAQEFRATMACSSWFMPFRSVSAHLALQPTGLPVLLIHGYGCNSGYWAGMSKVLVAERISHRAVDLEPVLGSIDEYVAPIEQAVEQLRKETCKDRIIIVAHSMGGLAARAWLLRHGTARVAKIITLGSPHHGTELARFGMGLNTQQMARENSQPSAWLRRLASEETPDLRRVVVSIYSWHDNIIAPQLSSHLEGGKNIALHAIGHVAMAFHPLVQAEVIREIRSAMPE